MTTKKGRKGRLNLSYNGFYGFGNASRKLDLLDATQYATIMNERYANGYVIDPSKPYSLPYQNVASLGAGTDLQITGWDNTAI